MDNLYFISPLLVHDWFDIQHFYFLIMYGMVFTFKRIIVSTKKKKKLKSLWKHYLEFV